jgi:hypothetical protein
MDLGLHRTKLLSIQIFKWKIFNSTESENKHAVINAKNKSSVVIRNNLKTKRMRKGKDYSEK